MVAGAPPIVAAEGTIGGFLAGVLRMTLAELLAQRDRAVERADALLVENRYLRAQLDSAATVQSAELMRARRAVDFYRQELYGLLTVQRVAADARVLE